ncbi:MAG: DUF2520 domain-containing protein [Deltaproteobacteria bacterium]|nr:MAG: DUF2520 domain-containing protein [Deltaproteobacteria bacterium]
MSPTKGRTDSFFVVGAGRVGTGLAVALSRHLPLLGTWNRSPAGARRSRRLTGAPASAGRFPRRMRQARWVFLTVPDDALAEVAATLAAEGRIGAGQRVVHMSGASSLSVLDAARRVGAEVGSLHPLRAFADPKRAAAAFEGALAVVAGEAAVARGLRRIARLLGMRPVALPDDPQVRALYHAGAVSAAGGVVTLLALALEALEAAGIEARAALPGLLSLARGSLDALERTADPRTALTGPVARGDRRVVEAHLRAMETLPEASRALYRALIRRSLALVGEDPNAWNL